jgi:general secretion pathway protein H
MEMMIVLIIAGFFIGYGANKLGDRSSNLKSTVRHFSTLTKKLRDRARVDNKTYRLVFDMPIDKKKEQSYWIESTNKVALLLNEDDREELEKNIQEIESADGKEKIKPDAQGFVIDTRVLKNTPVYLPDGLYFESIELDGDPIEKLSSGRVYIYFFPQGFVQGSAIHLTNRESLNWTLSLQGITGRVDVIPEFQSLEDLKER